MRTAVLGAVLVVSLTVGCSDTGDAEAGPSPTSVPTRNTVVETSPEPESELEPDPFGIVNDRAERTGLDSVAAVQLPGVERPADVRRYMADNVDLGVMHETLGSFVLLPDITGAACDELAAQLEQVASPAELQRAAAGIPDVVGAELYVGLVQATGGLLGECAATAVAEPVNDLSWQWLMTQRWNEELS